jgi:conjugative transfer signal peptidase TraF
MHNTKNRKKWVKTKAFRILFYILMLLIGLIALQYGLTYIKNAGYLLTYQVTTSMPKGFYLVTPSKHFHRGDIVLFRPPKKFMAFMLQKKWLPKSGLMLKYVIGVPGDYICQNKKWIYINHRQVAPIFYEYAPGKKLPNSHFCGKLAQHQYLLMSTRLKRSFDGRYFGPVSDDKIIGIAKRLKI